MFEVRYINPDVYNTSACLGRVSNAGQLGGSYLKRAVAEWVGAIVVCEMLAVPLLKAGRWGLCLSQEAGPILRRSSH